MCKLYGGALVSEHQTNQSSLKIQENQNEIHEPNSILLFSWADNIDFISKIFQKMKNVAAAYILATLLLKIIAFDNEKEYSR